MRILCAKDYQDMSRKAASVIAAQIVLKPEAVLGLATGTTPIGVYQLLIEGYEKGELDFSHVSTYNLDEYRGLSHDNPHSYHYFMRTKFFCHVNIDLAATHLPDGSNLDAAQACADYDQILAASGDPDLQLLGIGRNGHIGFNEPSEEFPMRTHCVDLSTSTIEANSRLFSRIEDVPRQAYTMGIQNIMRARRIVIIASGTDKAAAVCAAAFGPVTPRCPASILQLHPNCWLIADEAALSGMRDCKV